MLSLVRRSPSLVHCPRRHLPLGMGGPPAVDRRHGCRTRTPLLRSCLWVLLGLRPLHAAWTPDEGTAIGRRYLCDQLFLRSIPSAQAITLPPVDDAPRSMRLLVGPDLGSDIGEHISALGDSIQVLADAELATVENALHALAASGVVHLNCHGLAQLDRPLDSAMHLSDGSLTLLDIMEAAVHSRIVVLAACETAMTGTDLPDEGISLLAGLLQAGATGALGSLWAVPAQSSALLMRFFISLGAKLTAGTCRGIAPCTMQIT
jgi:hypothetical protein